LVLCDLLWEYVEQTAGMEEFRMHCRSIGAM
jgi:hypothetical protein